MSDHILIFPLKKSKPSVLFLKALDNTDSESTLIIPSSEFVKCIVFSKDICMYYVFGFTVLKLVSKFHNHEWFFVAFHIPNLVNTSPFLFELNTKVAIYRM